MNVSLACRIPLDFKTNAFRRALTLEGCGVFFCRPQVVHGLFRMGKIGVLQGPFFRLGQTLGFQGRPVLRVKGQRFLCPADDAVQHLLHGGHHLVDGACLVGVLLRLRPLELRPPGHALGTVKNAAPAVCHQFLCSLLVGQALGGIILHLVPDQLVHVLKALALRQVLQRRVLHRLGTLGIQSVVPVVVLV